MKLKLNLENYENIEFKAPDLPIMEQYRFFLERLKEWRQLTPHAKPLIEQIEYILGIDKEKKIRKASPGFNDYKEDKVEKSVVVNQKTTGSHNGANSSDDSNTDSKTIASEMKKRVRERDLKPLPELKTVNTGGRVYNYKLKSGENKLCKYCNGLVSFDDYHPTDHKFPDHVDIEGHLIGDGGCPNF